MEKHIINRYFLLLVMSFLMSTRDSILNFCLPQFKKKIHGTIKKCRNSSLSMSEHFWLRYIGRVFLMSTWMSVMKVQTWKKTIFYTNKVQSCFRKQFLHKFIKIISKIFFVAFHLKKMALKKKDFPLYFKNVIWPM